MNSLIGKWAKPIKRYFTEDKIQMVNKHTSRCSTSLDIWKIQIKTTVSLYTYQNH